MDPSIEGGCLCGKFRYRLRELPAGIENCHCVDCRRASGAPFVTWGSVPRGALDLLSGEVKQVRHASRLRSFAPCCGTTLFFESSETSQSIDIAIDTLDRPDGFVPKVEIWIEDRLPWVPVDPELKSYRQSEP